jgi:hypothetical protein
VGSSGKILRPKLGFFGSPIDPAGNPDFEATGSSPTTFPVASPATPIPMLLRKSRFEIIAISFAFVFP